MKHTFLRPAAFLLAAGLLFCTLFAPAAAADEQKDRLSGAVSSAKSQYEQEQSALQELQDRQKETEQRIKTVIAYAKNYDICRSRQLLRYFGEERSTDCDICDVCIDHRIDHTSEKATAPVKQRILDFLADRKQHKTTELYALDLPFKERGPALEYLISEEIIHYKDGYVWID